MDISGKAVVVNFYDGLSVEYRYQDNFDDVNTGIRYIHSTFSQLRELNGARLSDSSHRIPQLEPVTKSPLPERRKRASVGVSRKKRVEVLAPAALAVFSVLAQSILPAHAELTCEADASRGTVTCFGEDGQFIDAEGKGTKSPRTVVHIATSVDGVANAVAREIRVIPGQSIQGAINQAVEGDTIVVEPGVYVENLNFFGKAITVESEQGPEVTVIDGGNNGAIVVFNSAESRNSVLRGFTLTNGSGEEGGAIGIFNASPSILDNIISGNRTSFGGGGIGLGFASPLIRGNRILGNSAISTFGGGGISVRGASSAEIIGNLIAENTAYEGGAIFLFAAGEPLIQDNTMQANVATTSSDFFGGGAISMVNRSDALIVQNLITGNSASIGGGISWLVPSGARGPVLINNTIANNDASLFGSAIRADGFDVNTVLVNNILSSPDEKNTIFCGDFNDQNTPIFRFNDVFSLLGNPYDGACTNQTGINGNISLDPAFADPGALDFRLTRGSAAIDAGDNFVANLPAVDLGGNVRQIDGNGDGQAVVDMGAFEFSAPNTPPVADAGPDQTSECSVLNGANVTLDGTGSFDPDGDPITYTWTNSFGIADSPKPTAFIPLGMETVVLTVTDVFGASSEADTTKVTVEDTLPPTATATLNPVGSEGDDDRIFEVRFGCDDICDTGPTSEATVNGVPVLNGQIIRGDDEPFGDDDEPVVLLANCTDASGNTSTAQVYGAIEQ